ncbi:MAG: thiopeptide-type bacteriocin biosynthesis protein [Bacteroidales bacterium]|nr:thiopeptide-type bacteriocin biosynthesis protein [Bacteroidales bacterium]
MENNIQRTFIIGDAWCYFKIYTGFKTADSLLINTFFPLSQSLLQNNTIDKWFFIRYSDPEFHLRIRFHVKELSNIGILIMNFNRAVKEYVNNGLIWKIQSDTYDREIERYGIETMETSETFFWHDSEMIVKVIALLKHSPDEDMQWLLGLKMIDTLLDDFSLSLEEKHSLLQMLQEGFKREFGIDEIYKRQFGRNYRTKRDKLEKILRKENQTNEEFNACFAPIVQKSELTRPYITEIRRIVSANQNILINELLHSYIHMMLNRLFRARQRVHELVLYDYLFRYYTSQLAQLKKKE